MPSSSSRLTRLASEKRGGGSVTCLLGVTSATAIASPTFTGGQGALIVRLVAVFAPGVVPALLIDAQETVEGDRRAGGRAVAVRPSSEAISTLTPVDLGACHLARERALPDELVEPRLVLVERACERARLAGEIGGSDRLVRLLRVLGLGAVAAGFLGHVSLGRSAARSRLCAWRSACSAICTPSVRM